MPVADSTIQMTEEPARQRKIIYVDMGRAARQS